MDITVTFWYETIAFPLLTLMALLPMATLFTILLLDKPSLTRLLAYISAIITNCLSIYLLLLYNPENTGIQLAEQAQFFGMSYSVGVDGANLLFLPLTTVLTLLTLIYLQRTRYASNSNVFAAVLGYEMILIGAFSALNALQFWLWSGLELIPVAYLTIATGTGNRRREAVTLLSQFWLGGLLLTLAGFLLLGFGLENPDDTLSFDWLTLAQNQAPFMNETFIFILLMYGFAVRMPLFPFHAWLPLLAEQGGVVTSGIFIIGLKLGIYATIRFVIPLLPGIAEEWSGLVVALGLIGVFYGAILALMQNNLRRLLAFVIISQTGTLILGIFSFEAAGVEGSLLLSLAYGLAGAGLLFCVGFIVENTHTAFIIRLGGLFNGHIALGGLFLIAMVCAVAMPGTPSFHAGQMLIEGVVAKNGWIIALLLGIGNFLIAVVLLWAFQRCFLQTAKRRVIGTELLIKTHRERIIAAIISGLVMITGFYSAPWHALIDTATGTIGKYFYFRNTLYNELRNMPIIQNPDMDSTIPLPDEPNTDDEAVPHE